MNQFDTDELNGFDAIFRHSLLRVIDAMDPSILSNTTNIRLKKKLKPTVSLNPKGYTVSMGNVLFNPHNGHNDISTTGRLEVIQLILITLTDVEKVEGI